MNQARLAIAVGNKTLLNQIREQHNLAKHYDAFVAPLLQTKKYMKQMIEDGAMHWERYQAAIGNTRKPYKIPVPGKGWVRYKEVAPFKYELTKILWPYGIRLKMTIMPYNLLTGNGWGMLYIDFPDKPGRPPRIRGSRGPQRYDPPVCFLGWNLGVNSLSRPSCSGLRGTSEQTQALARLAQQIFD